MLCVECFDELLLTLDEVLVDAVLLDVCLDDVLFVVLLVVDAEVLDVFDETVVVFVLCDSFDELAALLELVFVELVDV